MNNKYNVQLIVPMLYKRYDILIPVNKTVGETIYLLKEALKVLTKNSFDIETNLNLYDTSDGSMYDFELFISSTNIKNGSILVLC